MKATAERAVEIRELHQRDRGVGRPRKRRAFRREGKPERLKVDGDLSLPNETSLELIRGRTKPLTAQEGSDLWTDLFQRPVTDSRLVLVLPRVDLQVGRIERST